ncbi:MAG: T9SS type A sorting domain-containing protein [candidate division Zixibacteria bacterium]|nr:T9SS type A sorting domain-containing protein [candidate division Zixibacteria bacterium]
MNGTYFGGLVIDSVVDVGISSGGCSFPRCTIVGEFNKDSYKDVLGGISTPAGGEAWIFLGGNPSDNTADWHYYDNEVGDYGTEIGASDINGDGVDEVIVGDPGWWWAHPDAPIGRVYIYDNPYTAVEEEEQQLPFTFTLGQNYPNPFNPSTTIPFRVGSDQWLVVRPIHTTLIIYNLLGQRVRILVDENQFPAYYTVFWDGKNDNGQEVSSGIYFYQIKAGSFSKTAKMSFLK